MFDQDAHIDNSGKGPFLPVDEVESFTNSDDLRFRAIMECWSQRVRIELTQFPGVAEGLDVLMERGISHETYRPEDFPTNQDSLSLIAQIRGLLSHQDLGGVILDTGESLDFNQSLQERARLLVVMIGNEFGETITINPADGSPFFPVARSRDGNVGLYRGNAQNSGRPGIHIDGSALPDRRVDFMALLSVRQAETGGDSLVVNARRVFEALPRQAQEFFLNREFARLSPYSPDEVVIHPVFQKLQGELVDGIGILYHRTRLVEGQDKIGEPLTKRDIEMLDLLDEYLRQPHFGHRFHLASGEALLLNNLLLCHDRFPFEDVEGRGRLLGRYWAGELMRMGRAS